MLSIEPVDRSSSAKTSWPLVEQRFGQVRADEAGSARDQDSHLVFYRYLMGMAES